MKSESLAIWLETNLLKSFVLHKRKLRLFVKSQFCSTAEFLEPIQNYTNCNECLRVLSEIKIPFEEIFVECKFGNQIISCKDSFEELAVGTFAGRALCYTFNGLNIHRNVSSRTEITDEWSIDDGYKAADSLDAYPRRALRAGQKFGLSVLMRSKYEDYDNFCALSSATKVKSKQTLVSKPVSNSFVLQTDGVPNALRIPTICDERIFFSHEILIYSYT
jgi:Amiloride-sensitive sodium channel